MHSSIRGLLAAAALAVVILPSAHAATEVLIKNWRMNTKAAITLQPAQWVTLPGGTGTYKSEDPAPGWTISGLDTGIHRSAGYMFTAPYPSLFAYIGGTEHSGGLTQQLGTLKEGASYTFTVSIGWRLDCNYAGYRIRFLANGVPLKTWEDRSLTLVKQGDFKPKSFRFSGKGHGGKTLTLVLSAVFPGANSQVSYDNPKLTYVIPAADAN